MALAPGHSSPAVTTLNAGVSHFHSRCRLRVNSTERGVARCRFLLIPALTTACGDGGGYWDLTVIVADFSTAQECVCMCMSVWFSVCVNSRRHSGKERERGRGRATHNLAGFSLKTLHVLCCVCGFDCCTCLSLRLCGRIRLLPHSINCVCRVNMQLTKWATAYAFGA